MQCSIARLLTATFANLLASARRALIGGLFKHLALCNQVEISAHRSVDIFYKADALVDSCRRKSLICKHMCLLV